ncbi:hypothetical protein EDD17DRAFT_1772630 [Pisolithus thermaeus]|nr:hypothetical protein EDD17DRAFT_1772630 [Pisolithus thermaeus]
MAPTAARPTTKKRNRKRKRRIASSSSESSSSDDSSSVDSVSSAQRSKTTLPPPLPHDDSEADNEVTEKAASPQPDITGPSTKGPTSPARDSPSPPPPSVVATPPLINPGSPEDELVLKEKFRKFWMASLAEGFKDDLEEPNLGQSRLALLIESLAAGAEVFSSTSTDGNVNEMEVVVDELS